MAGAATAGSLQAKGEGMMKGWNAFDASPTTINQAAYDNAKRLYTVLEQLNCRKGARPSLLKWSETLATEDQQEVAKAIEYVAEFQNQPDSFLPRVYSAVTLVEKLDRIILRGSQLRKESLLNLPFNEDEKRLLVSPGFDALQQKNASCLYSKANSRSIKQSILNADEMLTRARTARGKERRRRYVLEQINPFLVMFSNPDLTAVELLVGWYWFTSEELSNWKSWNGNLTKFTFDVQSEKTFAWLNSFCASLYNDPAQLQRRWMKFLHSLQYVKSYEKIPSSMNGVPINLGDLRRQTAK